MDYVHDSLSFGDWPTGPAWFIWLLLAFDLVVGAIFAFAPGFGAALSRLAENAREHPVRFFAMFVAASMAAYVPMVAVFGPSAWTKHRTVSVSNRASVPLRGLFLGGNQRRRVRNRPRIARARREAGAALGTMDVGCW